MKNYPKNLDLAHFQFSLSKFQLELTSNCSILILNSVFDVSNLQIFEFEPELEQNNLKRSLVVVIIVTATPYKNK